MFTVVTMILLMEFEDHFLLVAGKGIIVGSVVIPLVHRYYSDEARFTFTL